MKFQRKTLLLVMITLACWLGVGQALAAEFSALMVSRVGSQETQGKVFFQGEKMRQEFSSPQGTNINIARPDKMVMWMIMPGQKMYMEMPFNKAQMGKTMEMPQDKAQMKLLGTETVNGYETEKYETTMEGRGKTVKVYMWLSKKLGIPIKMVSEDGSFSLEYRDIKEGSLPAEVFEVPQGYQKMTMPQGMHRRR
jgi:hypothetical protein